MFSLILDKYDPKSPRSYGILKYFSEGLSNEESIQFVNEIFSYGSWILPTDISRSLNSDTLKQITSNKFHVVFEQWVDERILYSSQMSPQNKNPKLTIALRFVFREALLSIKNLGVPIESLQILDKMIVNCTPIYLERFYDSVLGVVIEEYDENDIERFLVYFIEKTFIDVKYSYNDFFYSFLNRLAYSSKIYNLSNQFLKLLSKLSEKLSESFNPNNFKHLISILLLDFIQTKKLDLTSSKYTLLIKETIDTIEKGNFDNLDLFRFLRRFNYPFLDFNVSLEISSLFGTLNEILLGIRRKTDFEKQSVLHHLINSSDKYFELLLFYLEQSSEEQAKESLVGFINLVDEIRESFTTMLWYDEFLNFTLIKGRLTYITNDGFQVKIDENTFERKIIEKGLTHKLSTDFLSHFGYGFLPSSSLNAYPQVKRLLSKFNQTNQFKVVLDLNDLSQVEEIGEFFISWLNYSKSNKKNVLKFIPFKDSIHKLISKYNIKAFFSSVELYLIEKASEFLSIHSPLPKKSISFKIIVPPDYFHSYNFQVSEDVYWGVLNETRPHLYDTIYVKHKVIEQSLKQIKLAHQNNQSVYGLVKSRSKGGLVVDIFGMEAFLPGSEIEIGGVDDYEKYLGQTLELKIVKINESSNNFIVSRKELFQKEILYKREQTLMKIERGNVLEGKVKNITNFGAFIDLGGVDGLLYISDMYWGRIEHPSDLLEIEQKVQVVVLDFEDNKTRISLGLKQLQADPWYSASECISIGQIVSGKIVSIEDYGAFLEISPGVEGLIHMSEVSWNNIAFSSKDFFKIGDIHQAKILRIDKDERIMSLSIKRLSEDPWIRIVQKFTIGSKWVGLIIRVTKYSLFVNLGDGIEGVVRFSTNYLAKIKTLSRDYSVGKKIDVEILAIDFENHKLSLVIVYGESKQHNPSSKFYNNSIHLGEVIEIRENGAIILFGKYDTAFCPKRHSVKADKSEIRLGDILDFKIIENKKGKRKLIVSHTCIHNPNVKNVILKK
jgi:small subunit ribosomal protein S1